MFSNKQKQLRSKFMMGHSKIVSFLRLDSENVKMKT